jgi:hypothetical protein
VCRSLGGAPSRSRVWCRAALQVIIDGNGDIAVHLCTCECKPAGVERDHRDHTHSFMRLEFFFINSFFPPQQRYNVIGKV